MKSYAIFCGYFFFLILILLSCVKTESVYENSYFPMNVLVGEQTGIFFSNDLEYKDDLNIIEYLYYYNGAGVAIGDINADGFEDIYLASNQSNDRLYLNKGSLKFSDITKDAGLDTSSTWSTGVVMEDIDGDGLLDIYVCKVGKYKSLMSHNLAYINQGDGTFKERAKELGLDFSGFSTQAVFLDYDQDGDLDMYLMNHNVHSVNSYGSIDKRFEIDSIAGDRFFENQLAQTGRFEDRTNQVGIYSSPLGYGLALRVADFNNDGWPDIYVGNDFHENDYIYINNRDKTFTESIGNLVSHTSRFTMGIDVADLNGDQLEDIYTTDMMPYDAEIFLKSGGEDSDNIGRIKAGYGFEPQLARNHLQVKNVFGHYDELGLFSNTYATDWSWGVLLADFDNDAFNDIFISNGIAKRPNDLDYINFISSIDFAKYNENDQTELEKSIINRMPEVRIPNLLFKNKKGLKFSDVNESFVGREGYTTGASFSDLDLDGDLDLVLNNINTSTEILENTSVNSNSVQVKLFGNKDHPMTLGSKVTVYTSNHVQTKEFQTVRGFQSSSSRLLHFGLDRDQTVDSIKVRWPDGSVQVVNQVDQKMISIERNSTSDYEDIKIPDAEFIISKVPGFIYIEDTYFDEVKEVLVPERLSGEGPVALHEDFNGDGLKDLFVGSAVGQPAQLFLKTEKGKFARVNQPDFRIDQQYEDTGVATIDLDKDGDLDLYVASGGNNKIAPDERYSDRIYYNDGNAVFSRARIGLPQSNSGTVAIDDFDDDGSEDFFIGSRSITGNYGLSPHSFIVRNQDDRSMDIRHKKNWGMVTDSKWADINMDGLKDLILVGDWMPITLLVNLGEGLFEDQTIKYGLGGTAGMWNCIEVHDFDGDGKLDLVGGNVGLNFKWKVSAENPATLYLDDFDGNDQLDPIITIPFFGQTVPFSSRDKLALQMPDIKKKFPSYLAFSKFNGIEAILGKKISEVMEIKYLRELRSMIYFQQEDGFDGEPLPFVAQQSTIEDLIVNPVTSEISFVGNSKSYVLELGPILANAGGVLSNFDANSRQHVNFNRFPLPKDTVAKTIFQDSDGTYIILTSDGPVYILEPME